MKNRLFVLVLLVQLLILMMMMMMSPMMMMKTTNEKENLPFFLMKSFLMCFLLMCRERNGSQNE